MRKNYHDLPDEEFYEYQECYVGFINKNNKYISYLKNTDFEQVAPKMITIYRHTDFDRFSNICNNIKWVNENDCQEKENQEKLDNFKYLFGKGYSLFNYLQVQDIHKIYELEKKVNGMFCRDLKDFYEEMGVEEELDTDLPEELQDKNFHIQRFNGEYKLLQYNFVNDYKAIEGIVGCLINLDNDTLEIYSEKLSGLDIPYIVNRNIEDTEIDDIYDKLEVKKEWRAKKMQTA